MKIYFAISLNFVLFFFTLPSDATPSPPILLTPILFFPFLPLPCPASLRPVHYIPVQFADLFFLPVWCKIEIFSIPRVKDTVLLLLLL